MKKTKMILVFSISVIILLILTLFSAKTGSIEMTFSKLIRGLFVEFDSEVATIYDLRFPRIIIAIIAGAAIGTSGVMLQAVMQNPLVDPGIIGISSAASLTGTIVLLLAPGIFYLVPALSILGGIIAYLLIYSIAWKGGSNPIKLILVGIALNMVFIGISEAIKAMTGGNLTNVQSIIEGNVAQKTWADVRIMTIYGIIGLVLSLITIRSCNLLSLEDETAKSIGVNVNRDRFLVALVAIMLSSVATVQIGAISFLGLIVPHIGRMIVGANHKYLLPFSMILGSIVLLLSDTLGRIIAYPYEIKTQVLMSVFGGIFFIILLKTGGREYGN
ncbi:MAG: iron ABC transporter permease [Peptoniphilus sp.]|uniref:FecCD family ABC transporter permease n=1 Tax=Peptoniphilus sp. TaxID=1971214 RepID=UPI002A756115|nr:iron ABC transporter permease [Peptoniphilus sp.]MDY2986513.1 iron ABC transporter permease [Peptoniphilus sp.]